MSNSYTEGQPLYSNTAPEQPLYCNLPDYVTSLPPGPPGSPSVYAPVLVCMYILHI